ncbi:MAG: SdrD B-like domain-containing protein [Candidatus Verstraetearchaeota archaeon]|nr:SdrD B-like domain-containing protein [Candidatus Verstraetearchaeota archaeon]
MKKILAAMLVAMMFAAMMPLFTVSVFAASVDPIEVKDWKSGNACTECEAASTYTQNTYNRSYKIDHWPTGDFVRTVAFNDGYTITFKIKNNDGTYFDWEASDYIGCVIVKGGTAANIYSYDPPVNSDTKLSPPINPNNNKPYGVSHVTFCWNSSAPPEPPPKAPGISVKKYASVDDAFVGDTVWYKYLVTNPGDFPLINVNVSDDIAGEATYISGDSNNDGFLDTDETWVFMASYTLAGEDVGTLTNTATAEGSYDLEGDGVEDGTIQDNDYYTIEVFALEVTKDASTSFTRNYYWTIDKIGDQTEFEFHLGEAPESVTVNYNVTVDATYTDSLWAVSGKISIKNPAPIDAVIKSVTDIVSPNIAAFLDLNMTFPYTLKAGENLEATYSADLPDAESRINTVTATLQNYEYKFDGTRVESGTTEFSATADVDFTKAIITEIDESITVIDDQYGTLGTLLASEVPYTFEYYIDWQTYDGMIDIHRYVNKASFETCDTGTTGSDTWIVTVKIYLEIYGFKFYDSNTNGVWDSEESPVKGFMIQLTRPDGSISTAFTNESGRYSFRVYELGSHTISEVMPANWINTTPASQDIFVNKFLLGDTRIDFGNVCLKPGSGGKTIGFWSNKNGQALINSEDVKALNALNLYKPTGWTYPKFSDTLSTAKAQVKNYLLSASAKEMKWMLSAQLIATVLNTRHGLSSSTIVYVGPSAYVPGGFITISDIISNANSALSGTDRSAQAYWKDICDGLNNNRFKLVGPPVYP